METLQIRISSRQDAALGKIQDLLGVSKSEIIRMMMVDALLTPKYERFLELASLDPNSSSSRNRALW